MNDATAATDPWVRLEIVSVTMCAYFREDSVNGFVLVDTITEMPCIVLELVSATGDRASAGVLFGQPLAETRLNAAGLAKSFGVDVVDHTLPAARRGQM